MREFKYNVVQLIQLVRDRPCLWDRTTEVYKDRVERKVAWDQVFALLDERYEEMTPEEKRITSEQIQTKWTNVRDTFVKTLKTRMGKPKRKYLLYEHLTFLLKVSNINEDFMDFNNSEDGFLKVKQDSPEPSTSQTRQRKRSNKTELVEEAKKSKDYDRSEVDYVEVDECNDPRIMNEDEAFFASLLPTVVKYSEDERLEFRIEVLEVMKKIKQQRKWC